MSHVSAAAISFTLATVMIAAQAQAEGGRLGTSSLACLTELKHAADDASRAEDSFGHEAQHRREELEKERAFAYRKLNLMRAVADAVASADTETNAVASAISVLRDRLGWGDNDNKRADVLAHFAPVSQALFASLETRGGGHDPDVMKTLADFENWYAQTHPNAFWTLFENPMPDTPRVDY